VIKAIHEEKLWYYLENFEDKLSINLLIMLKLEDLWDGEWMNQIIIELMSERLCANFRIIYENARILAELLKKDYILSAINWDKILM
jgi:hypothetical protein